MTFASPAAVRDVAGKPTRSAFRQARFGLQQSSPGKVINFDAGSGPDPVQRIPAGKAMVLPPVQAMCIDYSPTCYSALPDSHACLQQAILQLDVTGSHIPLVAVVNSQHQLLKKPPVQHNAVSTLYNMLQTSA